MASEVQKLPRKIVARAAVLLAAGLAALYVAGATSANPEVGFARPDLEILRRWQTTGRLEDHPSLSHLTKPGYLAYLRAALPSSGSDDQENRRFLYFNALWILCGIGGAACALWKRNLAGVAVAFLLYCLLHAALRDSADYVTGEPLTTAAALGVATALLWPFARGTLYWILLGASGPLLTLVRPNLGAFTLALAIIVILGGERPRGKPAAALLAGTVSCLLLLAAIAGATGARVNPFDLSTSKALVWGTADYYWRPDVGDWPQGASPAQTKALETRLAAARWRGLLGTRDSDSARALCWRLTHSLFSSEQLPPRWKWPPYISFDAFLRRRWWCVFLLAACAAVACVRGRGEWRLVPMLLTGALVVQGVLFGADPRFALPLLPLLALSLAIVLPTVRWTKTLIAGAAGTGIALLAALAKAPDSASSDFAVVRGPGHEIRQRIPAEKIPRGDEVTAHVRILKPESMQIGWTVHSNGRLLALREPANAPSPAYLSIPLRGNELAEARRNGWMLQIRMIGDDSARGGVLYYPVVPLLFGGISAIDGSERLPSVYGGTTRGGLPIWLHSGLDPGSGLSSPAVLSQLEHDHGVRRPSLR